MQVRHQIFFPASDDHLVWTRKMVQSAKLTFFGPLSFTSGPDISTKITVKGLTIPLPRFLLLQAEI